MKLIKTKIKEIEDIKDSYELLYNKVISNLEEIEKVYNPNKEITLLINKLKQFFEANVSVIQDKIDNSNEKKAINSLRNFKDNLSSVLKSINTQNAVFDTLEEKKEELITDVWSYLAFNSKDDIERFINEEYLLALEYFEHDKMMRNIYGESKRSSDIIEENRNKTVDTDTAKDKINSILESSGISGFTIEKDDGGNTVPRYYLRRERAVFESPEIFKTLSEGEKNFIAFLYFYQLCLGIDNEANREKKKIIVIDDPVSSLDSQVLFLVTTLIRDLAKKKDRTALLKNEFFNELILQIFVFTHNTYFFKEVTFPIGNKLCYDAAYFQVRKINGKSEVVRINNKTIDNDYNLLWRALIDLKGNVENNNNVVVGNIMRRILQTFLNFTRNNESEWKIIEGLPQNDPKRIIFSALISQINDDSHESNPLDELHFQRISQANTNDLFSVFELIFKDIGGEDHYNAMLCI